MDANSNYLVEYRWRIPVLPQWANQLSDHSSSSGDHHSVLDPKLSTCESCPQIATKAYLTVLQYISYFYKNTEVSYRMMFVLLATRATDIVAPLFALGLLRLRGLHGRAGWRWCSIPGSS